jgi:hypothetical protein
VLYQNQGGIWVYIAGIMYGTLVPDQRPADLGPAADAGFQFRTTTDPARAFTWNGGQWVETTPIRYGTHAERLAETIANLVSGMLWMETDRGSVIYQNQGGTWLFLSGTMWDTMSPDHRPTDLGVHDAGFDYRTTDPPAREFIWNQTAWVEITQSQPGDVQQSGSSASLTLTTTPTVIPGATLTLNRAGRYLITGNFVFLVVNDPSQGLRGNLLAGGVQLGGGTLVAQTNNNTFAAVSQQWVYAAAGAGVVVSLLANKDGGTGTSTAFAPATSITALWVST